MSLARGNDDLDLDGNWAVEPEPKAKKTKKRKAVAVESVPEVATGGAKKRKKKNVGNVGSGAVPRGNQAEAAAVRIAAAWEREAKVSKLTPLEMKSVAPSAAWFLECSPTAPLGDLPKLLVNEAGCGNALSALGVKKSPASPGPKQVSVAILCPSAERACVAYPELKDGWDVRPLALCTHGGGRKKEQVARQAKILGKGVTVAVGTPGRMVRMLEEGHMDCSALEVVVLDLTHDRKQRDVLSLDDTRRDFLQLMRTHLVPLLNASKTRLVICGESQQ